LPHEIEEMKGFLPEIKKQKIFYWTGTMSEGTFGNIDQLNPFLRACDENGIQFSLSDPWVKGLDRKELLKRTAQSFLAPAIVGKWQEEHGYIPCRIFINIAAGQLGVTN